MWAENKILRKFCGICNILKYILELMQFALKIGLSCGQIYIETELNSYAKESPTPNKKVSEFMKR